MEDLARGILALPPDVTLQARIVTAVTPLTVDVNGTPRVVANALGGVAVRLGDSLLVSTAGGVARAIANLTPLPTLGTVTALDTTTVTVSAGGLSSALAWAGAKPAVGDVVGIVWSASGSYVVGKLSQSAPTLPGGTAPVSTADPVPTAPKIYTLTIPAITVCSADPGGWTSYGSYGTTAVQGAWTGTNYKRGFWFYGAAFGGNPGRTCLSLTIELQRGPAGLGSSAATPAHLYLHDGVSKGGSPPNIVGGEILATSGFLFGETKSIPVPASAGQALLNGTAAGIAVVQNSTADHAQFAGITSYAASGRLTMQIQEA